MSPAFQSVVGESVPLSYHHIDGSIHKYVAVGLTVGLIVGEEVTVGLIVGLTVGLIVGDLVGTAVIVGLTVGLAVAVGVML